jgi:LmbE family N-acetylglucosaminyl deacetylase
MKTLLIVALSFTFCPFALSWTGASRCNVGNSSGCSLLPVDDFNACFTCDSGTAVEAGSCALQHPPEAAVMCRDVRPKCEAEGGVFTWCYGDSCNGCSPRYRTLPLDAWVDKSVVFVTAHPDDLEALAGATVAALVNQVGSSSARFARAADAPQGSAVNIIIITNGDKGCSAAFCQNYTSDQIAVTRRAEAVAAAAALGVQSSNVQPTPPAPPHAVIAVSPPPHSAVRCFSCTSSAMRTEAWLPPTTMKFPPPPSIFLRLQGICHFSLQVLRDVVQRLRLSRADVVISFYPFVPYRLLIALSSFTSHSAAQTFVHLSSQIRANAAAAKSRVRRCPWLQTAVFIVISLRQPDHLTPQQLGRSGVSSGPHGCRQIRFRCRLLSGQPLHVCTSKFPRSAF